MRTDTFYFMDDEVVIYVQKSEIEKFQKVFSGTIRPLEEYELSDIHAPSTSSVKASCTYDLTGRPVSTPTKGIYIRNGKIVLVR